LPCKRQLAGKKDKEGEEGKYENRKIREVPLENVGILRHNHLRENAKRPGEVQSLRWPYRFIKNQAEFGAKRPEKRTRVELPSS